jgi:hypothetical protein
LLFLRFSRHFLPNSAAQFVVPLRSFRHIKPIRFMTQIFVSVTPTHLAGQSYKSFHPSQPFIDVLILESNAIMSQASTSFLSAPYPWDTRGRFLKLS